MNRRMSEHFGVAFASSTSRRAALRGLGGAGLGATLVLAGSRSAAAHGAEDVAREAMEALNQAVATGDDSGLDALFAADVTVEPRHRMVATGEEVSPDLAGLKAALADIRGIAADIELVVDDLIADEDKAAGRFTVRGTLAGATEPLEASGLFFVVVVDDLVTELWIYPDPYLMLDLMAITGMATPVPSAQVVPVEGGGSYLNVSSEDLASMLAAKSFQLVNVHVPYKGEIEGTDLFIPYDQIEQNLDKLPTDTGAQIVLYCRSGRMSAIAAPALVKLGYTSVWNLAGGMDGWEQAGYPVVNRER